MSCWTLYGWVTDLGRAFSAAALEHVELVILHRELNVLHVPVMLLQQIKHGQELGVQVGRLVLQPHQVLRRADAGHHVLPTGVLEVLPEVLVRARGRVAVLSGKVGGWVGG